MQRKLDVPTLILSPVKLSPPLGVVHVLVVRDGVVGVVRHLAVDTSFSDWGSALAWSDCIRLSKISFVKHNYYA